MEIIQLNDEWRQELRSRMLEGWGDTNMVSRGVMHDIPSGDGFIAIEGLKLLGAAGYAIAGDSCEVTFLEAFESGRGVGSALLDRMTELARAKGCRRLWLITTNDNTPAMRFYQRCGMDMSALHKDELDRSRMLKPGIPLKGIDGIPIRHEIEFELLLR